VILHNHVFQPIMENSSAVKHKKTVKTSVFLNLVTTY